MTDSIWEKFNKELLGFISSRVKDVDIAEDILQQVFVKVHSKIHTLKDRDKLTSWVYQITRNTIIDYHKKEANHKFQNNFELDFPEDESYFNDELICCIQPFLNQLPEKYRDAFIKTSFDNIPQKDYAKQLNISYSATKSRVQRARRQLKEIFSNCCKIHTDKYGNVLEINKKNCNCG